MAGKLCKENIPVERLVGRGSAQATAETSVMLSGGDRNVALVSCRALPALGAVEVQTGGVAAQGTVEFSALYLTQEGALFSREAQANFSAVMQVEEAAPRMRARVRATIERVEAEEKDGRLELTPSGLAVAREIYERHKLLTDWLIRLGVSPETAAEDACRLEHDISPETFACLKAHAARRLAEDGAER